MDWRSEVQVQRTSLSQGMKINFKSTMGVGFLILDDINLIAWSILWKVNPSTAIQFVFERPFHTSSSFCRCHNATTQTSKCPESSSLWGSHTRILVHESGLREQRLIFVSAASAGTSFADKELKPSRRIQEEQAPLDWCLLDGGIQASHRHDR